MTRGCAEQEQQVAFADVACDHLVRVVDDPDGTDGWRGQDAFAVSFIIERHVAGHDGHIEHFDSFADPLDRTHELTHDLGLFRVAKVHVVGGRQWRGTHGGQVAVGFGDGLFAALNRVGFDVARGHVAGEGQRFIGAMHPHDARTGTGRARCVAHNLLVVLFIDPLFTRIVGAADQRLEPVNGVDAGHFAQRGGGGCGFPRAVVFGGGA